MIRIKLEAILKARGKTVYWLGKQTGLTTKTLYFIKHGKAKMISLDSLSKIYEALDCDTGDILVRVRKPKRLAGRSRLTLHTIRVSGL